MKIQFLHESLYSFLTGCRLREAWAREEITFVNYCEPRWEEVILWATEQTGTVNPLLRTLEDENASHYARRRAAEILSRVGQVEHVDAILNACSSRDHYVILMAGYALRGILARPESDEERRYLGQRLVQWTAPAASVEQKVLATKVALGVGLVAEGMLSTMFQALRDTDPTVRATVLNALGLTMSPAVVEPVIPLLQDSDATVRERALYALTYAIKTKRCASLLTKTNNALEKFQTDFADSIGDQYNLTFWIGSWATKESHTRHLLSNFSQHGCGELSHSQIKLVPFGLSEMQSLSPVAVECLDVNGENRKQTDHEVLQWTTARFLCVYPHRKHLKSVDWDGWKGHVSPATAELLTEVQYLREAVDISASTPTEKLAQWGQYADWQVQSEELVHKLRKQMSRSSRPLLGSAKKAWDNWLHVDKKVEERYGYFFGRTWEQAEAAYQFHHLSDEAQEEFVNFLAWQLRPSQEEGAEEAAHFLRHTWSVDERLLALRLMTLSHHNAQIRSYGVWGFNYHHCAVPALLEMLWTEPDATARGDAGGALVHLVGPRILQDVWERLEQDTSSLARGYIVEYLRFLPGHAEVQEKLIYLFSTDPDPWVRARAMRAYETVGDERGIAPLRRLFGDKNLTRWGMVGDIAREVHDALVQCPDPPQA